MRCLEVLEEHQDSCLLILGIWSKVGHMRKERRDSKSCESKVEQDWVANVVISFRNATNSSQNSTKSDVSDNDLFITRKMWTLHETWVKGSVWFLTEISNSYRWLLVFWSRQKLCYEIRWGKEKKRMYLSTSILQSYMPHVMIHELQVSFVSSFFIWKSRMYTDSLSFVFVEKGMEFKQKKRER